MYWRIIRYLRAKGISDPGGFRIQDDGAGPYIRDWNVSRLGTRPTDAQLNQQSADPIVPATRLDPRDFLHLFTRAERKAIRNSAVDAVQELREDVQAARYIEQGHPDTEAGIDALVTAGLLTAQRAAWIKSFRAPS